MGVTKRQMDNDSDDMNCPEGAAYGAEIFACSLCDSWGPVVGFKQCDNCQSRYCGDTCSALCIRCQAMTLCEKCRAAACPGCNASFCNGCRLLADECAGCGCSLCGRDECGAKCISCGSLTCTKCAVKMYDRLDAGLQCLDCAVVTQRQSKRAKEKRDFPSQSALTKKRLFDTTFDIADIAVKSSRHQRPETVDLEEQKDGSHGASAPRTPQRDPAVTKLPESTPPRIVRTPMVQLDAEAGDKGKVVKDTEPDPRLMAAIRGMLFA
mmetsp:Transcript_25457/g.49886  ORF Transcript_25457/g.49886 Transcript_25457/m.49886 type:complete len:266 (-) Transcript_25457:69-866(-)